MTYPMPYNLTGISGWFGYANTVSDGWFVAMLFLAVFIICFVSFKGTGSRTVDALWFSSIIDFVLTSLLWAGQVSPVKYVVIALIGVVGFGIWAYLEE